jgi:hypothetical protein
MALSNRGPVMANRDYWVVLFTSVTWEEFLDAGAKILGFRERRWKVVQSVKLGDYLLCYLTGISRFIGVLEVVSEGFHDNTPIWKDDEFPCRLKVKVVARLTLETALPVHELKHRLTIFENLKSPIAWTGHFRASPSKWNINDGKAVVEALMEARSNPVIRPVDPKKLARRPRQFPPKLHMSRSKKLRLTAIERRSLESLRRSSKITKGRLKRAEIILAAAKDQTNASIARSLGVDADTVKRICDQFERIRMEMFLDRRAIGKIVKGLKVD